MSRADRLHSVLSRAQDAYIAHVSDPLGRRSVMDIFDRLTGISAPREKTGSRIEAVRHLKSACIPDAYEHASLAALATAFLELEPDLTWYLRTGDTTNANDAYWDGHANAMIVGPGGLVPHDRVWLGVSLLAPGVRYPDHTHPPEETYLVLSDGEFYQQGRGWFTPGVGGTFYNPPGIIHAMRSNEKPLFAMWALKSA